MQPYQAWRRGLISYNTYLEKQSQINLDTTENASTAVVMVGDMNIRDNETWTVQDQETALGFIGSTHNLTISGTVNMDGDALFYTAGKGITISNTGSITVGSTGTLSIKPY